jgi:hypothetical protein
MRFESSRHDQQHQGLNDFPLGPFCFGVAFGIKVVSHTETQDIAMANHNNENL